MQVMSEGDHVKIRAILVPESENRKNIRYLATSLVMARTRRGVASASTPATMGRRRGRPQGRVSAGQITLTPRAGPRDARGAAPPELTFTSLEGLWRLERDW